jgi:hypothetical protein
MDVGGRQEKQERQASPPAEQRMQPIGTQQRAEMVGGGMAEGGVGVGPTPGQDGRALNDEVAPAGEPDPQPGAH